VKKLMVLLMLAAAPLQAQWFAKDSAHPESFLSMAPVDSLPGYWEYGQPKIYERWWNDIAACESNAMPEAGITLPANHVDVRFFEVNGRAFMPPAFGFWLDGATYPVLNEIYLASKMVFNEETVKHEMLHWILWQAGFRMKNFHPKEMFEICGIHRTGP
jgi:hypothetical protein